MEFLQHILESVTALVFLILYGVGALLIIFKFAYEKMGVVEVGDFAEPKDLVNYFLVLGGVAGFASLAFTTLGVIFEFSAQRDISPIISGSGISIVFMLLFTVLGSLLLPVLVLVGAVVLKGIFMTIVFLCKYLIIMPLLAWGDFLNRITGYTPEEDYEDDPESSTATTPKD